MMPPDWLITPRWPLRGGPGGRALEVERARAEAGETSPMHCGPTIRGPPAAIRAR